MVSIVIPSRNNEERIGRTLAAFFAQNRHDIEVVSCDDNSTDRTRAILDYYPEVKQLRMPPGRHFPGELLNHAIPECRGEIIVINHADACPLDAEYLGNLIRPLEENPGIAASFARQEARSAAPFALRSSIARKFAAETPPFSLAGAAIRRNWAEQQPFSTNLPLAFSLEWEKRLRAAGGRIVPVPDARLEYSPPVDWSNLREYSRLLGASRARAVGESFSGRTFLHRCLAETRADLRLAGAWHNLGALPEILLWRLIEYYAYFRGNRAAQAKGNITC